MNKMSLLECMSKIMPAVGVQNRIFFTEKSLVAFNHEIYISCDNSTMISGGVPAKELYTLLKKLKGKIEIEQQNNILYISNNTTKIKLYIEENIKSPEMKISGDFKKLSINFVEALKMCSYTLHKSSDNVFNNICVNENDIVSCDNFRVTRFKINPPVSKKFLLSASVLKNLIPFNPVKINFGREWIHFQDDRKVIFSIKKNILEYKNVLQFLETMDTGKKIILPKGLKESLERLKILAKESKSTKHKIINVSIQNNKMICYGESTTGTIKEVIECKYDGDEIIFKIIPDFLFKILGKTKEVIVQKEGLIFKGKNFEHLIKLAS